MNKSSKTTRFIVLSVLFHVVVFLGVGIYKTLDIKTSDNESSDVEVEVTGGDSKSEEEKITSSIPTAQMTSGAESNPTPEATQLFHPPQSESLVNKSESPVSSPKQTPAATVTSNSPKVPLQKLVPKSFTTFKSNITQSNTTKKTEATPALTSNTEPSSEVTNSEVHPNTSENDELIKQQELAKEEALKEEAAKALAAQEVAAKIEADKLAAAQKEEEAKKETARQEAAKIEAAKAAALARAQKEQAEIEKRLRMRKQEEAKIAAAANLAASAKEGVTPSVAPAPVVAAAADLAGTKTEAVGSPEQEKGSGNQENASTAEATPYPTNSEDIKSMGELKALPDNPRPQYTREERLRGDKGTVIFHAFINAEGVPTQFKMIESTGHKNLDAKSLKALKQWKFSPGQEGWAELSFKWNLEGNPEPFSHNTRTAGSRTANE